LFSFAAVARAHDDGSGKEDLDAAEAPYSGPPLDASSFSSHNVRLLSHVPLTSMGGASTSGRIVLGNDVWGWKDSVTNHEYALYGRSDGVAFVDVTDGQNPVYVGELPSASLFPSNPPANNTWRGIKVYNNYAFVVSEITGHGMQVFDLTRLRGLSGSPVTFTADARYTDWSGSPNTGRAHNIAINEQTGYAYLTGGGLSGQSASGGLHIVNIQNPLAPVRAALFDNDGYTHDAQIVIYSGPDATYAGREIAFCSNEDTLTIVDVTNKGAMSQLSRTGYPDSHYSHQGWLTEDQKYFLMDDELDETANPGAHTRTHIWNVQDLNAPVYQGYFSLSPTTIDHNLFIKGDYVYESNYESGLRVLKIGDLANNELTEYGYFDTYAADDGTTFSGAWGNYPFFESGKILVNDRQYGLSVLELETAPVPEPSSLVLAAIGIVGLGCVAVRRRRGLLQRG